MSERSSGSVKTGRRASAAKTTRKARKAKPNEGALARLRSIDRNRPESDPTRRAGEPSPSRRNRVTLGVAAFAGLVILATSFPLAGLLSQHRQLAAAAAQLDQLRRANRSLAEHQRQLNSKAAVEQLARQRYQLVAPGATLYDVLPPGGRSGSKAAAGTATSGDPGTQPPVAPANAPDLAPDPNLTPSAVSSGANSNAPTGTGSGNASSGSGRSAAPTSFWSRVGHTLEFWR